MPDRLVERISDLDWNSLKMSLEEHGYAKIPTLLNKATCKEIIDTYEVQDHFRSTIDMARYRFGKGEYKDRFCSQSKR
jgi:hypothetical protein